MVSPYRVTVWIKLAKCKVLTAMPFKCHLSLCYYYYCYLYPAHSQGYSGFQGRLIERMDRRAD